MTRSLRACKPISSLAELVGTRILTRRLTRRLLVSSLSVCRHCVAHCVSQHVVKPRGPAGSRQEVRPAPQGNHRLHLAHSNHLAIFQSIHLSLCCLPFFVHCSRSGTFQLLRTLTGPPLQGDCGRVGGCSTKRRRDSFVQLHIIRSWSLRAGSEVIKGVRRSIHWPLDKTQYATLCRRISLRTSTTSQVGSRT